MQAMRMRSCFAVAEATPSDVYDRITLTFTQRQPPPLSATRTAAVKL